MDLFKQKFEDEKLHPYFKRLITDKTYEPTLQVLKQWASGLDERKKESNKFINEFQTSFNSSLWELYLNKAFLDLGFNIDYSKESPDFNLIHPSGKIVNVEAVVSNPPTKKKGSNVEPAMLGTEKFLNHSTLKLLRKLKDKRDLFIGTNGKKYPYSTLPHVKGNPFVIAVAPFDNSLSFAQNNTAINKVLYGIDPPQIDNDGHLKADNVNYIETYSGDKIKVGLFTNDSYKEISAVIFSTTGMFGKAILQSGIECQVRATRYREQNIIDFISTEGVDKFGLTQTRLSETNEVLSVRNPLNDIVFGSDLHLCNASEYTESHIDGLHVHYNPYAEIPLNHDLINAYEITQNSYDIDSDQMICHHNDGSLVSRQVFT